MAVPPSTVDVRQAESSRHPTRQRSTSLQYLPSGHVSFDATHSTQRPVRVLHTAPSGSFVQSALEVQR
jgi:hypothetical protein